MSKRKIIELCLIIALALGGCGSSNQLGIDNSMEEKMEDSIESKEESTMYTAYVGNWSNDGKTHDRILSEGGVELSCTITESNQFAGTLFVQQAVTERFASIEEISGKIEHGELLFDYADDGWGNSGTLYIQFIDDSIYVEILNYCEARGGSDYGVSGTYELIRENKTESGITYASSESEWTDDEITNAIAERRQFYKTSAYYPEIVDYWENVREVRDVSNVIEPLFETDKQYYTEKDFENEPALVIHLAKNEIYARHGYIFKDEDLYNYFMGCIWYNPICEAEDFEDSVLNEYEKANLEILSSMDTY